MRMIVNVSFPTKRFNKMVLDGSAGRALGGILEEMRPEAVYFTEQDGLRTAILVVDLPEASRIPALAEPWFLLFKANVKLRIAMTPADLQAAGLEEIGRKYGKREKHEKREKE